MIDLPTPWEEFVKELKDRPYSLIGLLVLLWTVPYTYVQSARAQDFRQVQAQLLSIRQENQTAEAARNRENKEAQLARIESELFQLQQQVNDKLAGHKPVDALYYSRINNLSIDKSRLERELGRQP